MTQLYDLSDDSVFERTALGGMSTFRQPEDLSPLERRLLLMVTGYTPIKDLMSLLNEAAPVTLVKGLLDRGLIQPSLASIASCRASWPADRQKG